jgi:hypothetical protein
LRRFTRDPDPWRETIKLWCGLEHDSTELIAAVYKLDPMTAFECLADAQKVSTDLATEIVSQFEGAFATGNAQVIGTSDSTVGVIRAFAAIAADLRPRGRKVLAFLEGQASTSGNTQLAATETLALTNVPAAAEILARLSEHSTPAANALVRMGDLAVPPLNAMVLGGNVSALDWLQGIGTPAAALALTSLLWSRDAAMCRGAATRLAALLREPQIEDSLRSAQLSPEWRPSHEHEYVWAPFTGRADHVLRTIASRIALLIDSAARDGYVSTGLDPRIVLALIAKDGTLAEHLPDISRLGEEYATLRSLVTMTEPTRVLADGSVPAGAISLLRQLSSHQPLSGVTALFFSLPVGAQLTLWSRLQHGIRGVDIDAWRNVFKQFRYVFKNSVRYAIIVTAVLVLSAVAILDLSGLILSTVNPLLLLYLTGATVILHGWLQLLESKWPPDPDMLRSFVDPSKAFSDVSALIAPRRSHRARPSPGELVRSIVRVLWSAVVMGGGIHLMVSVGVPYFWIGVVWSALIVGLAALWITGRRREIRSQNPLFGLVPVGGPDAAVQQPSVMSAVY